MPTLKEIAQASICLKQQIDFTIPSLTIWKTLFTYAVTSHLQPMKAAQTIIELSRHIQHAAACTFESPEGVEIEDMIRQVMYHSNPNPAFMTALILIKQNKGQMNEQLTYYLFDNLKRHSNPVLLAKAALFMANTALFSTKEDLEVRINVQRLMRVAELWFGEPELEHYFKWLPNRQFTKELFNKLIKISEEPSELSYKQFSIACSLCHLIACSEANSSETDILCDALGIMQRFFKNEGFLFKPYATIMQIPNILKNARCPFQVAICIVKMENTGLFIVANDPGHTNYIRFIEHAELWFDDFELNEPFDLIKQFDAIPTCEFTQVLFNSLIQTSEQETKSSKTKRKEISHILSNASAEKQNRLKTKPNRIPGHVEIQDSKSNDIPTTSTPKSATSYFNFFTRVNPYAQSVIRTTIQNQNQNDSANRARSHTDGSIIPNSIKVQASVAQIERGITRIHTEDEIRPSMPVNVRRQSY